MRFASVILALVVTVGLHGQNLDHVSSYRIHGEKILFSTDNGQQYRLAGVKVISSDAPSCKSVEFTLRNELDRHLTGVPTVMITTYGVGRDGILRATLGGDLTEDLLIKGLVVASTFGLPNSIGIRYRKYRARAQWSKVGVWARCYWDSYSE